MNRSVLLTNALESLDTETVRLPKLAGVRYARFKHLDYNDRTFSHVPTSKRFEHLDFRDGFASQQKRTHPKWIKRLGRSLFPDEWETQDRRRQRELDYIRGIHWIDITDTATTTTPWITFTGTARACTATTWPAAWDNSPWPRTSRKSRRIRSYTT